MSKIVVLILTWKRISRLKTTLLDLSKQSFKDFEIYISNGNLDRKPAIEKYATYFRKNYNLKITVRHDGNSLYAFRRITVGKELAELGAEIIFYLDDDITIPKNYIEKCLSQYETNTYHSGFAWTFFNNGKDYYKDRERRSDNEYKIHYCGSGVAMIDAKILLNNSLSNLNLIPHGALKIEDLWLSYYVDHVLKAKLKYIEMPGVQIGGADSVALYKDVSKDSYNKTNFLIDLIQFGWSIPKEKIKA